MLQLFGEVFWSISTTTPNTIHQRLPSWFNGALFCWAWLEMTFFNELGSNSLHKTCDLASAFRQGCQIAKFTKFKKVGKFSFAQTSIAAVLRSCSNFKQRHFGVKDSKHQRISLSEESILLACWKCERPMWEAKAHNPLFRRHPKCKSQRRWNGAKRWGKWGISHRAATKSLVFQVKETISSWCKNVAQNLSQSKQYQSAWRTNHISTNRISLLHISRTCNCCI